MEENEPSDKSSSEEISEKPSKTPSKKSEKGEKGEKGEKSERSETSERPSKTPSKKSEKGEKGEKSEKSESEVKEKPKAQTPVKKEGKDITLTTSRNPEKNNPKPLSNSHPDNKDGSPSMDKAQIRRRASELKISEKKRVRSISHGNFADEKEKTDQPATEGKPRRALRRDRSISGSLGKRTKGFRSKFMKTHTLDRNFTIDNGILTYSGKGKEPNFKIPLDEVKATKLDIKNDVKKGKFAFQIETPKRNFVLYADTEDERETWLLVLQPRKEGEGDACATTSCFKGELFIPCGEQREWIIQGVDKFGQLCIEGGNKVSASLRKKLRVPKNAGTENSDDAEVEMEEVETLEPLDLEDVGDGTYRTIMTPKIAYNGKLVIDVEGDEMNGSPLDFSFIPGRPSLKHSSLRGTGLRDTKMYLNSKIIISMHDEFDNPSPNVPPVVTILTKSGEEANFQPKKESRKEQKHIWDVIYIADREGEFKVLISVEGENWGEFPVTITKAPASATKSTASGPGLKKVYQYKQTTFKMIINDEGGRKCSGDHQIGLKFFSPEKKDLGKFDTKITKNEDDTWSVSYVPSVGGIVIMHVLLYDQDIPGSPFTVEVAPAKGAIDKCKIEGPGLSATQIYETTHCIVTVNDQMGKRVKEATVGVAFGGKKIDFNIIDNGDGTFMLKFTPNSPGLLIMSVTMDGKQMKGSPFQLNINESSSVAPHMCNAVGNGIKRCIQYRRSDFSIFLRDEQKNPVSMGNIGVGLKGTDEFEYSIANTDIGSYFIRYKTTAPPGEYKLLVTVDDEDINGSPFFLTVEEGNPEDETPLEYGYPRLIRLSVSGKYVLSTLVPLSPSSLNQDDVFLLDNEINIYQWNGPNSSRVLKVGAGYFIVNVLSYDRRSGLQHKIIEDPFGKDGDAIAFWKFLGVTDPPKKVGNEKITEFIPRCLEVDEDENIEIIAEGSALKMDVLSPDKLIILDTGYEVIAWEGRNCPNSLKRYAYQAGKDYVKQYKRPEGILIIHILDGSEYWTMKHYLQQENII